MNEEIEEKTQLAYEKREREVDIARRERDLHGAVHAHSPVVIEERECRYTHIITRKEAIDTLQVTDKEFNSLVKACVIRKAHPDKRSWYVFKDVHYLAGCVTFSEDRKLREAKLRLQNTCNYLSKFAPSAYFNSDGEVLSNLEMDEVDLEVANVYRDGMASMSSRFRSLCKPVYGAECRDHRTDRDVQYLYLTDEESPKMTTALSMRRWYRETHTQGRYQISRITIPPLKALNRPEHQGVLKFLVQSAEILYGVSFETLSEDYYEGITAREMELSMNESNPYRLPLYDTLTGSRISDDTDFAELLAQQGDPSVIPLDHTVAAWYQAYRHLITRAGNRTEFAVKRAGYIKSMLQSLINSRTSASRAMAPEEIMRLRMQVEKILGCQPGWASRYKPAAPPVYIGHPPCLPTPVYAKNSPQYNPDPLRVMIHPAVTGLEMVGRSNHLLKQNSLENASADHKTAASWLISALDEFHAEMSKRVTLTSRTNLDRILMGQLFRELKNLGVSPRSLYLHPYRDAERLVATLKGEDGANLLMDIVLANLKEVDQEISMEERKVIAQLEAAEQEQIKAEAEETARELRDRFSGITQKMRVEYMLSYAIEKLKYSSKDLVPLTAEELVTGLTATGVEDLNNYILESINSEAEAEDIVISLE